MNLKKHPDVEILCINDRDSFFDINQLPQPVDVLFKTKNGMTINEINHTMEFRNSITTTGVNIPQKMAGYVLNNVA